jgi:hypothetical protein
MGTPVRRERREFLKFLAASPYGASLGGVATFLEQSCTATLREINRSHVSTPDWRPGVPGQSRARIPANGLQGASV